MAARKRPPGFFATVVADARTTAAFRGERYEFGSVADTWAQVARLAFVSDAFAGQIAYRAKVALQRRRVPVLPRLMQRVAIAMAAIYIDDEAVVQPGLYVVHGQVVVDGPVLIGPNVVLSPAVTIAAPPGGPPARIGAGVNLGTGARVLGSVAVGPRARIGAAAVVSEDVPAGGTAVGVGPRVP